MAHRKDRIKQRAAAAENAAALFCGIMSAERTLYLRRAAGARREPKHYCGECASLGENIISEGDGIIARKAHAMLA